MGKEIKVFNKGLLLEKSDETSAIIEESVKKLEIHITRIKEVYSLLSLLKLKNYSFVITEFNVPVIGFTQFINLIRKINSHIPVILLYGKEDDIKTAEELIAKEIFCKFQRPLSPEKLFEEVRNLQKATEYKYQLRKHREALKQKYGVDNIIGQSKKMEEVYDLIDKILNTDVTVYLQGESGTGKELIAKLIYQNSMRKDKPFVVINCAAIPENLIESEMFGYEKGAFTGAYNRKFGKFELGNGGTVFLDEIGELSLLTQSKILRILEEREFERIGGTETIRIDIRLIAATNKILERQVSEGKFRKDLFYRINVFPIYLPALRERKEDISLLAYYFLEESNKKNNRNIESISTEALKLLQRYNWPGNIRELENVIERATLVSDEKDLRAKVFQELFEDNLFISVMDRHDFKDEKENEIVLGDEIVPYDDIEKVVLKHALKVTNGNISHAARELRIGRATLYRKLQRYNIELS